MKKGFQKGNKLRKGKSPWNKGIKLSYFVWNKGIPKSEISKQKQRETMRNKRLSGNNNGNWKGGITSISNRIRNNYKYRQWRSDIFTRDNYKCIHCGLNQELQADHFPKLLYEIIKEYNIKTIDDAYLCEELWNINNGRTLCRKCHYS